MEEMSGYSGSISIYFPCKLKPWASMRRLNNRLRRWQQRQVRYIHHSNAPLTDLMDKEQNRNIMESFLSLFQRTVAREFDIDENRSPFGLKCLRLAYRKNREDNLFSKNVQIVLSRFSMEYRTKNGEQSFESEGVLLLNINADNRVATLVVTLNFKKYDVLKLVYLKHIFFKRLLVSITEYDTSIGRNCSTCGGLGCFGERGRHFYGRTTIQEFVNNRSREILSRRELAYDVDYRARYSFIELTVPSIKLVAKWDEHKELDECEQEANLNRMQELYGIMMSDEGCKYLPTDKLFKFFRNNYSTRSGYDLFLSGLNAMIVTRNMEVRNKCRQERASFEKGYDEPQGNIQTEPRGNMQTEPQEDIYCIPGVWEGYFPSFLKAVEIHYLINKVTTNEIAYHERSFLYPWIFLHRLWLLWEILYDVDSHKYHINQDFHTEFGILRQLKDIREEYNTLLNHTLSYSMALITVLTALFGFIQLWK